MYKFLKKYVKDLHLEVSFIPLVNGELLIELRDNSYNLKGSIILPEEVFTEVENEEEKIDALLSPIVAELGEKRAKIYSDRFKAHKRQEFERFWRGE